MAEISLSVASGVLAHATADRAKERQIAYSEASPEIACPRRRAQAGGDEAHGTRDPSDAFWAQLL